MSKPTAKALANLRPIRDTKTAQERGKLGGIKSQQVQREHKMMREAYAELLKQQYNITVAKGSGLVAVIQEVLEQTDDQRARVAMLKEIRDGLDVAQNIDTSQDADLLKNLLGG